jgi:hypothetical protein
MAAGVPVVRLRALVSKHWAHELLIEIVNGSDALRPLQKIRIRNCQWASLVIWVRGQGVLRPEAYEVPRHNSGPQASKRRRRQMEGGGLKVEGIADTDRSFDVMRPGRRIAKVSQENVGTETKPRSDYGDPWTRSADRLNCASNITVNFSAECCCSCQRRRRSASHVEADNSEAAASARNQ